MQRNIKQFTQHIYDLLVIGGGINGAAIAHMAALNGLKTALIEKNDFSSGTSSKSTKLIHGGLRYLENFEFGLVRESLKERSIQLKSAPHLVKPLLFAIPLYTGNSRPAWMIKLGVWLYDSLSGKYLIQKHKSLSKSTLMEDVPGIEERNLLGAVTYYDAQMNDARLCLENVLSAIEKGAHAANYMEAKSFLEEKGKVTGVIAYDHIGSNTLAIRAKKIVCAVGPWTNKFSRGVINHAPTVRTTKGIHIVYQDQFAPYALLIPTRKDRRVFFIIPWLGHSLIGTTDTDFAGDPDQVGVDENDIDYLLSEMKRIFPEKEFSKDKIISTFAGLRPLVFEKGAPSKVSRQHTIEESSSGVVYVVGGKYTTYRKIAEDTLKKITNKILVNTEEEYSLYGGRIVAPQEIKEAAFKYSLTEETIQYLVDLYGSKYRDVLAVADNVETHSYASLLKPMCSCSLAMEAQIIYALKTEMACTQEDILYRRLSLGYFPCKDGRCRDVIRRVMKENM